MFSLSIYLLLFAHANKNIYNTNINLQA